MKTNAEKLPSPWVSAIPLAVLTGLLYVVIRAFGGEAINGGSQIALLSATSVCVMLSIGISAAAAGPCSKRPSSTTSAPRRRPSSSCC